MPSLLVASVLLIILGSFGWQFLSRMQALRGAEAQGKVIVSAGRYRPMLRLLSEQDLELVAGNSRLRRTLRRSRREMFRSYLRCLTKDYAHLLAGVRLIMVHSGTERPDLARALAKNRILFALAMCKVECRLALHAAGLGSVDISGLVDALEAMRGQVAVLSSDPRLVPAA